MHNTCIDLRVAKIVGFDYVIDYRSSTYVRRVVRALDRRRVGVVALAALLLSAGPLTGSGVLQFFTPAEIAVVWLEHLLELAILAAILTIVFTLADEALAGVSARLRLGLLCAMLLCMSGVLSLLLYGYYAHGFDRLPPSARLVADALRFGLPAVFLVLVADVHRRALQIDSAAHAAEMQQQRLDDDEAEQQLALLQAQIEPHFLFNVLGNVRRLYRTAPDAGSEMIDNLMRYLRAALPQLRSRRTTLRDETELVRAYVDLLRVRMGTRIAFSVEADAALGDAEFPPMLLVTLVENAIKHGVEPVGGGSVGVRALRVRDTLNAIVFDDGAGLGAATSGGTGVGLANIRRQLAARYGSAARLTVEPRVPRGTSATISMPFRTAMVAERPIASGPPGHTIRR
jgi:hypothetical protein